MIVVRYTHLAKPGHRDELVELLKDWLKVQNLAGRVSTRRDAWDTVCCEIEYATEEEHQKFVDNYDRNRPELAELHKRFDECRAPGTTREEWIVH